MRIQTFNAPAGAAGSPASLTIPVFPGEWCQVVALCFVLTTGGGARFRPKITFAETSQTLLFFVVGLLSDAAITELTVCALRDCDTTPKEYINNALADGTIETVIGGASCNVALPKYMFDRNFTLQMGADYMAGGDIAGSVRVVVAFGTLEEINVL
jgi:hypothetical protein